MQQLTHLLKNDFVLLQRNKIVGISIAVSIIYVAVFKALSVFGNTEKAMVLVIFNDPALLGFMFVGVMVLFEKNENTLEALAVSPMRISNYILSKTIALTSIAVCCCFAMAIAGHGWHLNYFHFALASVLTTFLFSFIGFIAVAGHKTFNTYLLNLIGVILLLSIPFLGYFEVTPKYWYVLFPTQPAIDLFVYAFSDQYTWANVVISYALILLWCYVTYRWALKVITKNFRQS